MKNIIILAILLLAASSFNLSTEKPQCYDPSYVEQSTALFQGKSFTVVSLLRDGNRVKAKYFAAEDWDGSTVYERFQKWRVGKNIVVFSSGTYMDRCEYHCAFAIGAHPVGLTVDNGIEVTNKLEDFDGLVIVYATGGIACSNLDEGNLTVKWSGTGTEEIFNLKGKPGDLTKFKQWAVEEEATVFQTHLLAYKNVLKTYQSKYCDNCNLERERRFLVGCRDEYGNLYHVIVHTNDFWTLYAGASKVFEFLKSYKEMDDIVFMVNLDTGCQNVFQFYDQNCVPSKLIKGVCDPEVAANLLVYYYE